MRIKLIEELPMATSAELYQLSWVIEQLLADPRRIVQARGQLHTGQQVQYLHWDDGKLRSARVVSMKDRRVTVLDEATRTHRASPRPQARHQSKARPDRHRRSPVVPTSALASERASPTNIYNPASA